MGEADQSEYEPGRDGRSPERNDNKVGARRLCPVVQSAAVVSRSLYCARKICTDWLGDNESLFLFFLCHSAICFAEYSSIMKSVSNFMILVVQ